MFDPARERFRASRPQCLKSRTRESSEGFTSGFRAYGGTCWGSLWPAMSCLTRCVLGTIRNLVMHRSLQVLMIEAWGLRGALRATTNCYTEERLDAAPCAVRSQQAGDAVLQLGTVW